MAFKTYFTKRIAKFMEVDLGIGRYFVFFFCVLMAIGVYFVVMAAIGVHQSLFSLMFVPIVIAALLLGTTIGALMGIIGGLAVGVYVPLDLITMEPQATWSWVSRMVIFCGTGAGIGLFSDGIRYYIAQEKWTASHNITTQLPNKTSLERDFEKLRSISTKNDVYYLVMCSLENMREIDSNCEYYASPSIILQVAFRANTIAVKDINIYHLDDNKIALLFEGGKMDVKEILLTLRKYFQEPFKIMGLSLHCDIQIGGVRFTSVDLPVHAYIQQAYVAISTASESSTPVLVADMVYRKVKANDYFELLGNLKTALDDGQLKMHFQPQINLRNGEIEHVEALMRWKHPTLGDIPPVNFIPRAESSTLIDRLTYFAIDDSLAQVVILRKRGVNIRVAVNISARNLSQPKFVYQIMTLLKKHELDGSSLELELTESSLMKDVENVIQVLDKIDKLGVAVSIDDFGTGYSSLQYLQSLPVSILKIDQSFIKKITTSRETFHIVEVIISLAQRLDMKTIAEGVEDIETLLLLREMGCDLAQGYHISRPCSPEEFGSWYLNCGGVYQIEKSGTDKLTSELPESLASLYQKCISVADSCPKPSSTLSGSTIALPSVTVISKTF